MTLYKAHKQGPGKDLLHTFASTHEETSTEFFLWSSSFLFHQPSHGWSVVMISTNMKVSGEKESAVVWDVNVSSCVTHRNKIYYNLNLLYIMRT